MADEKKDDKQRFLGPGAKGDPENPAKKPDLEKATAKEVVEAVETGQVTPSEALEAEQQRDKPRKTVTDALKGDETKES